MWIFLGAERRKKAHVQAPQLLMIYKYSEQPTKNTWAQV